MDNLKLEIPQQAHNPQATAFTNPVRLKSWLAALPLGNAAKTGHELLAALYQTNRAKLPLNHRYALLERTRPIVANLLPALHKQYDSAPIPLPEKQSNTAELVRTLLKEVACGYKISILELAAAPSNETIRNALIAANYHAIDHLARLLVETYCIYAPEPKKLWLEVNQLYRYAELNGFQFDEINQAADSTTSIDRAYRRLLLLALANPYHLMQGETLQIYHELGDWSQACRLQNLAPGNSVQGSLFVDLESDAPPRYAPAAFTMPLPLDGRILDITPILSLVERRIKEVTLANKTEAGQLTLMGRKQRNMYKRLAEAWGMRSERLSERKRRDTPVTITIGISACHHYAGGGVAFAPEASEIELRRSGVGGAGDGLSLISADETPWLSEDKSSRLTTGIVQPRTSQFINAQGKSSKDVWVKVYSTQAQHEHEHEKSGGPHFNHTICLLQDASAGGMSIESDKQHNVRMNVGEVMAFLTEDEKQQREWSIGTVRWLRLGPSNELSLGIRVLADDALPVATRGVRGAGRGGEYFRSLLIPKLDPSQYPTSLITPAAIYDVDSIILINTGEQLLYAHLTKLVEATNAYSQFQFQIVPPPEDETGTAAPAPDKGHRAI